MKDLIFAFNICRYVKSNAIVLAQMAQQQELDLANQVDWIAVKLQ